MGFKARLPLSPKLLIRRNLVAGYERRHARRPTLRLPVSKSLVLAVELTRNVNRAKCNRGIIHHTATIYTHAVATDVASPSIVCILSAHNDEGASQEWHPPQTRQSRGSIDMPKKASVILLLSPRPSEASRLYSRWIQVMDNDAPAQIVPSFFFTLTFTTTIHPILSRHDGRHNYVIYPFPSATRRGRRHIQCC